MAIDRSENVEVNIMYLEKRSAMSNDKSYSEIDTGKLGRCRLRSFYFFSET
jgi:hypothetical protein